MCGRDARKACGGRVEAHDLIRAFYEAEKPVATHCHGVSALVDLKLSNRSYPATGKTVRSSSGAEEDYRDTAAGAQIMRWRLEPAVKERGRKIAQVVTKMLGV